MTTSDRELLHEVRRQDRRRFRPLAPVDGYLPIEDHGLIGDGATAALAGPDGAVSRLCVPRFDAEPVFYSCSTPGTGAGSRSARSGR